MERMEKVMNTSFSNITPGMKQHFFSRAAWIIARFFSVILNESYSCSLQFYLISSSEPYCLLFNENDAI